MGNVGFDLYWEYFKNGGIVYFFFTMFLIAISVGLRIFIDYFIGSWISNEFNLEYRIYVSILFGLAAATTVLIVLRGIAFGHYISLVCFNIFKKFMEKLF